MNAAQIIITCATKLNQMSTPMIAANGASIGLRDAPVNRRAPSSCITATARAPSAAPTSVNLPARMCATTRSSSMNNAKFSNTPVAKPVDSSNSAPGSESSAMPSARNTSLIRPPETTPAAVDNMNSTATMIAATVSRNRALTTFSSCVQSSNMVVTALRREFIQPVTVHQNTASVTRPVHVSVCEIPLSIDAENSESETLGITVRSIASSVFCISSLPVTTSPSALTTIHTPAKNANSSPYASPFASSGPRRDTYRSITRPVSERRHHATSESIASPILCSHCMIRLYAVARLSTTTAIVVAHMGIEVKRHAS